MTSEDIHYVLGNLDGVTLDGDILPDRNSGLVLGRDIVYLIEEACDRMISSKDEITCSDDDRTFYRPVSANLKERLYNVIAEYLGYSPAPFWAPSHNRILEGTTTWDSYSGIDYRDILFPERYSGDIPPSAYEIGELRLKPLSFDRSAMLKYFECLDEMRFCMRRQGTSRSRYRCNCTVEHGSEYEGYTYPPGFTPLRPGPTQSGPGYCGMAVISSVGVGHGTNNWFKSSIGSLQYDPYYFEDSVYYGMKGEIFDGYGFIHWRARGEVHVEKKGVVQKDVLVEIDGLSRRVVYYGQSSDVNRNSASFNFGTLTSEDALPYQIKRALEKQGVTEVGVANLPVGDMARYYIYAEVIDPIIVIDYTKGNK